MHSPLQIHQSCHFCGNSHFQETEGSIRFNPAFPQGLPNLLSCWCSFSYETMMSIGILEYGPASPQVRSCDSVSITLFCGTRCSVGRSAITIKKSAFKGEGGKASHQLSPFLFIIVQLESYFYVLVLVTLCTFSL